MADIIDIELFRQTFLPLDQFNFHQKISETNNVALAMFEKQGCSSCNHWKNLLFDYKKNNPNIDLFIVDAESEAALAQEFDIFHLPAFYLYKDGQFHSELQCEGKQDRLEQAIEKHLNAPPCEAP